MTSRHDPAPDDSGSFSRREFLRVGGLSVVGLSLAEQTARRGGNVGERRSCIFLLMTGGASHLETFDPKPEAPSHIRGPLKAISTAVPGTAFGESLPKLAERADRFTVLRSLHHRAAPIHETGYQLLHTGRLAQGEVRFPSFGSVTARELGPRGGAPPCVVIPRLLGETGVEMYRGQTAGLLGEEFDPAVISAESGKRKAESGQAAASLDSRLSTLELTPCDPSTRRRYGDTRMGELCLQARQLVEAGVRCVVVNLFDRLAGQLTWDCHGHSATTPGTIFDYRDMLCPQFDLALSALLDDLQERGLLEETFVVATGEFGRTPRVNSRVGRDHWPGVWSALLAGGPASAGAVVGESDAHGFTPAERPVTPAELRATILQWLVPHLLLGAADEGGEEASSSADEPAPAIAEVIP